MIDVRKDVLEKGRVRRKKTTVRLTSSDKPWYEVRRLADEYLRKLNNSLETIGAATNFEHFVTSTYKRLVLPLTATTTKDRYEGVLKNYLLPEFGANSLAELTPRRLQ